jgi:hypothetical protein
MSRSRLAVLVALAVMVLPGAAAASSGGSGTVTASGRVGTLRINESGLAEVVAFAGQPDAQTVAHGASGRLYDAFGYGCSGSRQGRAAPVGRGTYCRTAFYVDVPSDRLEQFFTTSRRYHDNHGIRVGTPTSVASRLAHRDWQRGCFTGISLRRPRSLLNIGTARGHVTLLAVDSTLRSPGVFACI